MRLPWSAFLLAALTLVVYLQSSGGLLYPDFDVVAQNSFGLAQPFSLVFHLFYHLGVKHFVGNVLPLFVFAFLLALVVPNVEVVLLFLASGILSAAVFSLLNPSSFLVGASSGVSALMTSAALLKPKLGVVLLAGVPLLTYGAVFPLLDQTAQSQFQTLENTQLTLEKEAADLEAQNRFEEAKIVRAQAEQTAVTLRAQEEGKVREEAAKSDFLVHLTGALLGAVYVLGLRTKELEEGLSELWPLFDAIRGFFSKS